MGEIVLQCGKMSALHDICVGVQIEVFPDASPNSKPSSAHEDGVIYRLHHLFSSIVYWSRRRLGVDNLNLCPGPHKGSLI